MDVNAINKQRKKIEQRKTGKSMDIWKPNPGKNSVRIVPYKYNKANPFSELHWHYRVNGRSVLCLDRNFGEDCPVCKFATNLWKSEIEEDKEMAKKMFAKNRFYVPIIVRGKEEEGVKFWGFGQTIYDSLVIPFQEGEVGDYTDIENGMDIHITRKTKEEVKSTYGKTIVRISSARTPMLPDNVASEELMTKILENQKRVEDVYENCHYTYEEAAQLLKDWLKTDEDEEEVAAKASQPKSLPFGNDDDDEDEEESEKDETVEEEKDDELEDESDDFLSEFEDLLD